MLQLPHAIAEVGEMCCMFNESSGVNKTLSISDCGYAAAPSQLHLILIFTSACSYSLLSLQRGDTPLSLIINHQNPCPVTPLAEVLCCALLFCSVLFAVLEWALFLVLKVLWHSTAIQMNVYLERFRHYSQNFQRPLVCCCP